MNRRINLNEIANVGDKAYFEESGLTEYDSLKKIEYINDINEKKSKYSVIFGDNITKPKEIIHNANANLKRQSGFKDASITYIKKDDERPDENAHIVSIP